MKFFRILTILALLCASASFALAQKLEPTRVSWKACALDVTITEGLERGVNLADCFEDKQHLAAATRSIDAPRHHFAIECLFDVDELAAAYPDGVDCVVKWYYYLSTKRMLMFTSKKTLSPADVQTGDDNNGFVVLRSLPRLALRTGWWEVTITNLDTKEDFSFGGSDVFKVRID